MVGFLITLICNERKKYFVHVRQMLYFPAFLDMSVSSSLVLFPVEKCGFVWRKVRDKPGFGSGWESHRKYQTMSRRIKLQLLFFDFVRKIEIYNWSTKPDMAVIFNAQTISTCAVFSTIELQNLGDMIFSEIPIIHYLWL